jgi:LacI family transcriptional regulator
MVFHQFETMFKMTSSGFGQMSADEHKVRRVNLAEVAKRAGVGVATVDRVLNDRGNVSLKTTHKVLEAARELHVNRVLPAPYHKIVRIEVLLARPELPLIARMNEEFRRLSEGMDRSVVLQRTILTDEKPETMAHAMRQARADAMIVYTLEHESIYRAIAANAAKNIPTITIISDLPQSQRFAYAGTDHYRAGRTAAYFIDRMVAVPGPILLLCNHLGFQGHASRMKGFIDYLDTTSRHLRVTEILEGQDDHVRSELVVRAALGRHPDLVAIYNVGAGNRGVAAAIQNLEHRPVFVGHELTDTSRLLLRRGVMALAIDQNPEYQARLALEIAFERLGFVGAPWITLSRQPMMPFTLYCPENFPV